MTRWFLAAAAIGALTGCALILGRAGAIGVAVTAAGVIAIYGIRAVRRDRQREKDKARHPSSQPYTLDSILTLRSKNTWER